MNFDIVIPSHDSDDFHRRPAFWSACTWLLNAGHPVRQSVNPRASIGTLRSLMNRTMGVYVFEQTMLDAADHVGLAHRPNARGYERFAISQFALRDLERTAARRQARTGAHHAHRPYLSDHPSPPAGHSSTRQ